MKSTNSLKSVGDRRFFRVPEAASILKVSKSGLYRLLQSGNVKAVRLGRSIRISEAELTRLSQTQS
jgi:excisionase family DNA binding protein